MIDKSKLINTNIIPKNTIKYNNPINISETFSNNIIEGDYSNLILNSNLENEDIIK
ncbi:hypothetical protein [Clostridium sp.]|uniref:hypothetical protein n=1 Tax=Clostridium sp. TaxID=1506 RepID=UPI0026DDBCBE|nr:hypothetical protein [Clostridium sp.]MDO5039661.1 hypothetical protein [Clostridium sp.]